MKELQKQIIDEFAKHEILLPEPIIVYHEKNPQLYDRFGTTKIALNISAQADEREFAYELSHELCHLYLRHDLCSEEKFKNLEWYEELIATVISLKVLKILGSTFSQYEKKQNNTTASSLEKASICVLEHFVDYVKDGKKIYSDQIQLGKFLAKSQINPWKMLIALHQYTHS